MVRFLNSVIFAVSSATAFMPSVPSSIPHRSSALYMSTATDTGISGTVKWYNTERGFGFITRDDGGEDMYVHATNLTFNGPLEENDRVTFATELDTRTNKPKAVSVVRSDDEAPAPAAEEEPAVESVVEKVMEAVKEDLDDDVKRQKAVKAENFQRARLGAQLEQKAAAAAIAAEEDAARELGYPSVAIMKARQQPKSAEEEAALASKYSAMELGEKAFTILVDLGLELNTDPDDPSRDTSKDDEDME